MAIALKQSPKKKSTDYGRSIRKKTTLILIITKKNIERGICVHLLWMNSKSSARTTIMRLYGRLLLTINGLLYLFGETAIKTNHKSQINMKIQARLGTFETNSSTQHTLCIVKPDKDILKSSAFYALLPDRVNVPCFDGEDAVEELYKLEYELDGSNLGDLPLDKRVTLLVASVLNLGADSLAETMASVQEILGKIGVELFIDWEAVQRLCRGYYLDGAFNLLNQMNREETEAFLLADDCQYACWCDECSNSEPKEYSDLMERVASLGEECPDNIVVMHERC